MKQTTIVLTTLVALGACKPSTPPAPPPEEATETVARTKTRNSIKVNN